MSGPLKHAHSSTERCASCGATLTGRYCARCGAPQPARLSFRRVFKEGARAVTELDIRIVNTFMDLTIRPGVACRSYVDGNRRSYTNPLKYAFISATVHILLVNLLNLEVMGPHAESASVAQARAFEIVHNVVGYLLYPVMIPAALFMRGLFIKDRYNVAECYVFLIFVYGHLMWLLTASALLLRDDNLIATGVGQLVESAYFIWALIVFYGSFTIVKFLKSIALRLACIGLFFVLSQGAIWLIVQSGI